MFHDPLESLQAIVARHSADTCHSKVSERFEQRRGSNGDFELKLAAAGFTRSPHGCHATGGGHSRGKSECERSRSHSFAGFSNETVKEQFVCGLKQQP